MAASKKDSNLIRGFQLMAAYHHDGSFNNDSYHKLSRTTKFTKTAHANWDLLIKSDWRSRKFEKAAEEMYKLLMQFDYFIKLKEWGWSVRDLISDGATIGYYVGLIKHHEKLGSPTSNGTAFGKLFGKNAYILLDRLLVEGMKGMWGGSGDSAAQRLIQEMAKQDKLLKQISDSDWQDYWTKLVCGEGDFSTGSTLTGGQLANDQVVSKGKIVVGKTSIPAWVKKMMMHYYCTSQIKSFKTDAVYSDCKEHWDHIFPDTKFTAGSSESIYCVNIANVCILPDKNNIRKSAKVLTHTDCQSGDTKVMIERYSELDVKRDGPKYDDEKKTEALVRYRGQLLMDNFVKNRVKLM